MKRSNKKLVQNKKNDGGELVFAIIADYKDRGEYKLILHPATPEISEAFSFGDKEPYVISLSKEELTKLGLLNASK